MAAELFELVPYLQHIPVFLSRYCFLLLHAHVVAVAEVTQSQNTCDNVVQLAKAIVSNNICLQGLMTVMPAMTLKMHMPQNYFLDAVARMS